MPSAPKPRAWSRLRARVTRFFIHDVWRMDRTEQRRFRSFLAHNARLVFLAARDIRQHQCSVRAASLTFTTIFGLVPFLAVALLALNAFADLKVHEERVLNFLVDRLPSIESAPRGDPAARPDEAPADYRESIRKKVHEWVGKIQYGRVGIVALLFCLYVFYKLLSTIEAAFNNIWSVKQTRTVLQKLRTYWMMVIVPVLVAAYVAIVTAIHSQLGGHVFLSGLFVTLSEMLLVWLAAVAAYWLLPNTVVHFSAAAVGALFTAAVMQLLKQSTLLIALLFGGKAKTFAGIYGTSIAIIPVFLFVLFVMWLVVLVGAELSHAAQNVQAYARDRRTLGLNPESRERLGLRLLLAVAARFQHGEPPPSSSALSDEFDVSLTLVQELLGMFENGALIRSSSEEAETVWQPARPLDSIRLADAIACIRRKSGDDLPLAEGEPLNKAVTELVGAAHASLTAAFGDMTLRDLLAAQPKP